KRTTTTSRHCWWSAREIAPMGFMNLIRRRPRTETRAVPLLDDTYLGGGLFMLGAYGSADAGVTVTPETALQAAAVWSAVSRIARDLSTLPVHIIDRQTGGRVEDHPIAALLRSP